MNKKHPLFEYEILSNSNLNYLTELTTELWPECDFAEEKRKWNQLMGKSNQFVELSKINDVYIGFIHVSVRHKYVEGSDFESVAYLEGIYVMSAYRKKGIAKQLLDHAEKWANFKGLKQIASDTEIINIDGQSFHRHTGFTEVNRIVCFIKNLS